MENEENRKEELNEVKKEETIKEAEVVKNNNQESNATKEESKGLSIAAMVLGIIALVFWCVWYISIPCAILAIIFGAVGRKKAGRGMAIAGLVLGIITAILLTLTIILGVTIFSSIISSPEVWEEIVESYEDYDYDYYDYNYDI